MSRSSSCQPIASAIPAQLLDLPKIPTDGAAADPHSAPDARARSIAAATARAQAYLDGSIVRGPDGFHVELSLKDVNGSELARGEGDGFAQYQAVRAALAPIVASGAIPAAKVIDPRLGDWAGPGAPSTFVVLPKIASDKLPRRGRTTVEGTLDGKPFQATLEPDGQLSHWLPIDRALLDAVGRKVGDTVTFAIASVEREPEPEVPGDLSRALAGSPDALAVWNDTTTIARVDWIHWIVTAKQAKTRAKRVDDTCDMLASGKKRVCCFDPSGFYSNALKAPDAG